MLQALKLAGDGPAAERGLPGLLGDPRLEATDPSQSRSRTRTSASVMESEHLLKKA
jgi:hypothetical protein